MFNKEIGLRIKKVRSALGISQMKLAEAVEVSFQQIQKYESGVNQVSLVKLKKISKALNIPFHYLAGGEEDNVEMTTEVREESMRMYFDDLSSDEIQLVVRFRSIQNENIRKSLLLLLKGIETLADR